jgi:hypothetical protein
LAYLREKGFVQFEMKIQILPGGISEFCHYYFTDKYIVPNLHYRMIKLMCKGVLPNGLFSITEQRILHQQGIEDLVSDFMNYESLVAAEQIYEMLGHAKGVANQLMGGLYNYIRADMGQLFKQHDQTHGHRMLKNVPINLFIAPGVKQNMALQMLNVSEHVVVKNILTRMPKRAKSMGLDNVVLFDSQNPETTALLLKQCAGGGISWMSLKTLRNGRAPSFAEIQHYNADYRGRKIKDLFRPLALVGRLKGGWLIDT